MSQESQSGAKGLKDSGELLAFSLHWNPEDFVSTTSEGMLKHQTQLNLRARVKASRHNAKSSSSMSFCLSCHQKIPFTFRVGLPALNHLIKKISWLARGDTHL